MYNESALTLNSHIPLSDGGGGGQSLLFSVNTPTDPVSENFSLKHL